MLAKGVPAANFYPCRLKSIHGTNNNNDNNKYCFSTNSFLGPDSILSIIFIHFGECQEVTKFCIFKKSKDKKNPTHTY